MKKTYNNPQLLIVRVNTRQNMLITSVVMGTESADYLGESDILTKKNSSYSIWDDDWIDAGGE